MSEVTRRLTNYADMSEIHVSEMQLRMIERLLHESDVRNHPTTRAFFALLRPEISEQVAEFYLRFQRMAFEIAFGMRWIISRWEQEQASDPREGAPKPPDFYSHAHDLVTSLFSDNMHGFAEIEQTIGALRGDLDGGIGEAIDRVTMDAVVRLLDDDAYGEELLKEAAPTL